MEKTFHMLLYRAFHAQRAALRPHMAELGLGFLGVEHFTVGSEETGVQVHRILLGAEIALLEACTLKEVPAGEYLLVSPPLKYGGLDGAQARPLLLRD